VGVARHLRKVEIIDWEEKGGGKKWERKDEVGAVVGKDCGCSSCLGGLQRALERPSGGKSREGGKEGKRGKKEGSTTSQIKAIKHNALSGGLSPSACVREARDSVSRKKEKKRGGRVLDINVFAQLLVGVDQGCQVCHRDSDELQRKKEGKGEREVVSTAPSSAYQISAPGQLHRLPGRKGQRKGERKEKEGENEKGKDGHCVLKNHDVTLSPFCVLTQGRIERRLLQGKKEVGEGKRGFSCTIIVLSYAN